jgi:membrane protein YqaA with SNARE-associated domain
VSLAALAWGFAEATLFFLVPDVLLTWIALSDARAAWRACLWALAGALLGGLLMFAWGWFDHASALAALDYVPAVSAEMCEDVAEQLREDGARALFVGPATGTPYKIYAVQAPHADIDPPLFLLVSVPARLVRFVLVTGLAILLCRLTCRWPLRAHRLGHVLIWIAFYGWYFWHFGW